MRSERSESSVDHPVAISPEALCRLLEERQREADARLAIELSARMAQVSWQESLLERLGAVTDLYELCQLLVDEACGALGATNAMLGLVLDHQFLEVVATTIPALPGYGLDLLEEAFIAGETLAPTGEDSGELLALGTSQMPAGVPLLAAPLFRQDGKPLGAIFFEGALRPERREWVAPYLQLVAHAVEDCLHYNRIEAHLVDAVTTIALAHEARRPDQAGHCGGVEEVAAQLARGLGLTPSQEKHIRLVALLHDMAPEAIARAFSAVRRGQETETEWQQLMADPFVGGIYPSPLANLQKVIDELRYLHARYDGKGNAAALAGEGLPIAARVVAVAEAFENLTSGRDHRTTLAIPAAIRQILRYAGAQYDPRVVEALRWHYLPSALEMVIPLETPTDPD